MNRLSENLKSVLIDLGATTVSDLARFYDDTQILENVKKLTSNQDYENFLSLQNSMDQVPLNDIEKSVDVRNTVNSITRWGQAMLMYSSQKDPNNLHDVSDDQNTGNTGNAGGEPSSEPGREPIIINALIDQSYSMEGTKLIAVKLGLCALISQLEDYDIINITSFSDRTQTITGGFQTTATVKSFLPKLLYNLQPNGSTSLFDTVIEGIRHLRNYSQGRQVVIAPDRYHPPPSYLPKSSTPLTPSEHQKIICIPLTDGEDTCSKMTSSQVLYRLTRPGIDNFMFILLAIDMRRDEERMFRSWMELRHCKQISVNIRSGSRLVQIFKEVLLERILQSNLDDGRFYRMNGDPACIVTGEQDRALRQQRIREEEIFQAIPSNLIRQQHQPQTGNANEEEENPLNYSPPVSRRNSLCDDNYDNNDNDDDYYHDTYNANVHDDNDDYDFRPNSRMGSREFYEEIDTLTTPVQNPSSSNPVPPRPQQMNNEPRLPGECYCPITVSISSIHSYVFSICVVF